VVNILHFSGTIVEIAQYGWCALYFAARVEYNAHRFVDKAPISAEIRSIEYSSLNIKTSNYNGFDREQCCHSANWILCPVFDSKCEV
jgi:hypothetical protein